MPSAYPCRSRYWRSSPLSDWSVEHWTAAPCQAQRERPQAAAVRGRGLAVRPRAACVAERSTRRNLDGEDVDRVLHAIRRLQTRAIVCDDKQDRPSFRGIKGPLATTRQGLSEGPNDNMTTPIMSSATPPDENHHHQRVADRPRRHHPARRSTPTAGSTSLLGATSDGPANRRETVAYLSGGPMSRPHPVCVRFTSSFRGARGRRGSGGSFARGRPCLLRSSTLGLAPGPATRC